MLEQSQRAGGSVHEIIAAHSAMVYRLALARTGSRADAEDVYQEVFFRYFRTNPQIESPEHLKAWLIRTTIHTSVNLLRSAWRRYFQPMPENYDASAPEPEVHENPRLAALSEALKRLPENQRVAIHLYYYEQLSTDEIAEILGEKGATIRSRLKRGREKLKSLLTEVK
ncbi:MAG: RNA polymerase sigma factor [Clostridia bacterium]|nr:RNA polymerase sigma factor [Clostridia bacterium]